MNTNKPLTIFVAAAVVLLAGCLADVQSKEENTSPVLAPIGDRVAVASNELAVTLSAIDTEDGLNLTYTADGTVGPQLNPFAQTTPAVWDASNKRMTWTPTATEADKSYSVKFTVTDRNSNPLTDRETITIEVFATALEGGKALYGAICGNCHGANPDIQGATADNIRAALNVIMQMQVFKSQLTDANISWLAEYLASVGP